VLERTFFDVRVFHAPAPTNMNKPIQQMYLEYENEKKRSYNARVIHVEKGTFTVHTLGFLYNRSPTAYKEAGTADGVLDRAEEGWCC